MSRRDGQVIRRGDRKFLIRWPLGEVNGKRRSKSKTIRGTKRDADRELRQIMRARDLGEYVEPSKRTLDELLDTWLESSTYRVSGRTLRDVNVCARSYFALGSESLKGSTFTFNPIFPNNPSFVESLIAP